jgi:hypothetical protein
MVNNLDGFANSCRVKGLIAVLGLASFAWVPSAHAAKLIWTGDFSNGDLSGWNKKLYAGGTCDYVSTPKRGKYGSALCITKNTTDRNRAEIVSDAPGKIQFVWDAPNQTGPEYWWGGSLYMPSKIASINTLVQVHARTNPNSSCKNGGNAWTIKLDEGTDNFQFTYQTHPDGDGQQNTGGSQDHHVTGFKVPATLGVWHDFVVRFKLSMLGNGYIEVWHNGIKKLSKFGLYNVSWKDMCGNSWPGPGERNHNGIHTGIYAGSSDTPITRSIYLGEYRVAEGSDGYDMVAPGGGSNVVTLTPPPAPTGLNIIMD